MTASEPALLDRDGADDFVAAPQANTRDLAERRQLGAFYTPSSLTDILCDWAIRHASDTVFEPAFGGCTFLESALARLKQLNSRNPRSRLFGCDIDPIAFKHLTERIGGWESSNFLKADFLTVLPSSFPKVGFDAVIGNPPYIRQSHFSDKQALTVKKWIAEANLDFGGRTGLWAYFVIHALSFLKPGGRIAWVLPGSFLSSKYASKVRAVLAQSFTSSLAICVEERIFLSEGTEERSILLIADGFGKNPNGNIHVKHCKDVKAASKAILLWEEDDSEVEVLGSNGNESVVPLNVRQVMRSFSEFADIREFGNIARIQIGIVTGNNKFFIRRLSEWRDAGISRARLRPILPRIGWLSGIDLTANRFERLEQEDIPCLIFDSSRKPWSKSLKKLLSKYPGRIKENATFGKRERWHNPFDGKIADAFLAYVTHFGPRVVLNTAGVDATNSVYRVFFNEGISHREQELCAVSVHTTFCQLWAEAQGRGCGSGALKLEPSEMLKIPLPLPKNLSSAEVNHAKTLVQAHLERNEHEEARRVADDVVWSALGNAALEALPELVAGLIVARRRRMRQK